MQHFGIAKEYETNSDTIAITYYCLMYIVHEALKLQKDKAFVSRVLDYLETVSSHQSESLPKTETFLIRLDETKSFEWCTNYIDEWRPSCDWRISHFVSHWNTRVWSWRWQNNRRIATTDEKTLHCRWISGCSLSVWPCERGCKFLQLFNEFVFSTISYSSLRWVK